MPLNNNSIGPHGARCIAAVLGECQSLQHLDISSNNIRDEGA